MHILIIVTAAAEWNEGCDFQRFRSLVNFKSLAIYIQLKLKDEIIVSLTSYIFLTPSLITFWDKHQDLYKDRILNQLKTGGNSLFNVWSK